MVVWLPLHGFVALAMPFCKHTHLSGPTGPTTETHVHSASQQAHHMEHPAKHDHAGTTGLACNDCGACHLACSPAAPVSQRILEATSADCFVQSGAILPPLFIPEQGHRPPLAAIA